MLKAGPQNPHLEGQISFHGGQVAKLIQSLQLLMCSDIASIWCSSAESRCKRKCMDWFQQKEERMSGPPLHTANFKLQSLPTRGKTPAEVGIYFLSKCKCPHMPVQAL